MNKRKRKKKLKNEYIKFTWSVEEVKKKFESHNWSFFDLNSI